MAGRGPQPKDPEKRQRRNAVLPQDEILADARHPSPPELVGEWSAETQEWWETWCSSPQGSQFTVTDWQRLRMLAQIVERFWAKPTTDLLGEIRLNEAKLGATPEDRQRLRQRIVEAQDKVPAQKRRSRERTDPRKAHLKAV